MFKTATLALLVTATALLSACGGGSSPAPTPPSPPPPPTQADVQDARAAQLTAVSDPATKLLTLRWLDTFPAGTTYSVLARQPDGSFASIDSIAGIGGESLGIRWEHALAGVDAVRVQAQVQGRQQLLYSPRLAQTLATRPPAQLPSVVVDQVGPVTGRVGLTLDTRTKFKAVSWLDGETAIGTPWESSAANNGHHSLTAQLMISDDSWFEIHRDLDVSNNPNISVSYRLQADPDRTSVVISPYANDGTASVSGSFDGGPPIAGSCDPGTCEQGNPTFTFAFDNAAHLGPHTLQVVATSHDGYKQALGVPFVINSTRFTPADGAIVAGTLQLAGTAVGAGPVVVSAWLGSQPILVDASSPFATSFDLGGTPPGEYQLQVYVDDLTYPHAPETHTIFVASGAGFVYEPVITLGKVHTQMLAADGDLLVYEGDDGAHLLDTAAGSDRLLASSAAIADTTNWQIDGGRVFAEGSDPLDCEVNCIYAWTADGVRTNLSASDPVDAGHEGGVARDGVVVWEDASPDGDSYDFNGYGLTSLDLSTGTYSSYLIPDGIDFFGSREPIRGNGSIHVYYAFGTRSNDVWDWNTNTGEQILRAEVCCLPFDVHSDGQRLGWIASGGAYTVSLAGGDPLRLSSDASETRELYARDGVIVWRSDYEHVDFYGPYLRAVDSNGVVSTLAGGAKSAPKALYGTYLGIVAFQDDEGLKTWDASTGATTLRFAAEPNQVLFGSDAIYFSVTDTNIVYKIPLR